MRLEEGVGVVSSSFLQEIKRSSTNKMVKGAVIENLFMTLCYKIKKNKVQSLFPLEFVQKYNLC